jgi:putative membrane protein
MHRHIVIALKGMAFGLSNIVPGMTGGAILIVLGIHGRFVDAVGNLATNKARRREYLIFLGALGLGAAVAMVGLSRALTWLLDWRPVLLTFLFKGLLLGTIPALFRLHSDMRITPGRALAALLGLALVMALRALERQNLHAELLTDSRSLLGILYLLAAAFVAGAANVTPGISGSYVFLLAGVYRPILDALSALARLDVHWHVLAPTAAGAALGIVACSKLIDTALKQAPAWRPMPSWGCCWARYMDCGPPWRCNRRMHCYWRSAWRRALPSRRCWGGAAPRVAPTGAQAHCQREKRARNAPMASQGSRAESARRSASAGR